MPTYDYRCPKCGKFTVSQRITEKALEECPTCSSPVSRLIGRNVNIIYKCSGFYCKDTFSPSGVSENKNETGSDCKQAKNDTNNVNGNTTAESKAGESKSVESKSPENKSAENKTAENKTSENKSTGSKSA